MTEFEPVFLPEDKRLNGRTRQTFLRHFAACPRSAFLSQLYNGEAQTKEMMRGSALHRIQERAVKLMVEMGEPTVPPDVVKVLVDEVLAELYVPWEEHDYLRECAWRWSAEFAIDPPSVVACETLFAMRAGGYEVRCRVDFAEILDGGSRLKIVDTKSSRAAPPYDEIARKMADGRLVPKQIQLVLYALVLVHGVPIDEDGKPLASFPAAPRAQQFELEFLYPGIEDREGKMVRRPMVLDHLELAEYRSSLEGLVERVAAAESSGDWPAVVSDAACSECPAPGECPIPREVRDWRGRINTPEQAADAARVLDRQKAELRAAQTELRNFAKVAGESIRFDGKVMEFRYSEHESFDHKGFLASPGAQVEDFVKVKGRTDFAARDLTIDEKENEGV